MKTNNKQTKPTGSLQKAINGMARQLCLMKEIKTKKDADLEKITPTVNENDAPFRDGMPFSFEEAGTEGKRRRVTGRLVLKYSRNWDVQDVQVEILPDPPAQASAEAGKEAAA